MKNTIIIILCFAALLMLGGFVSVKMMAKLDDEANRVASLEGRVEDLNGINYELNNEIASLTDALDQRDADLHTITDAIKELQEPTTEEEKEETTEEDSNESALESNYDGETLVFSATKKDGETSSTVPVEKQDDNFDTVYVDEPSTEDNSSSTSNMTYLGVYELTAYEWTGSPCANGNFPTVGYTVACNSLPLGTRIYIEGMGEYTVEDRGGMSGGVIDVYMGDYSTCIQFGRRSASVYIIN